MEGEEEFQSRTLQLSQLLVVLDEQVRYHAKAGLRYEASPVFLFMVSFEALNGTKIKSDFPKIVHVVFQMNDLATHKLSLL